MLEDTHVKQ